MSTSCLLSNWIKTTPASPSLSHWLTLHALRHTHTTRMHTHTRTYTHTHTHTLIHAIAQDARHYVKSVSVSGTRFSESTVSRLGFQAWFTPVYTLGLEWYHQTSLLLHLQVRVFRGCLDLPILEIWPYWKAITLWTVQLGTCWVRSCVHLGTIVLVHWTVQFWIGVHLYSW